MASTSRIIAAGLRRQWPQTQLQCISQPLLLSSSQFTGPTSTTSCANNTNRQLQHQQQRLQSDHLKQRALDALKSKKTNAAANSGDRSGDKGPSKPNLVGGTGKLRNVGNIGKKQHAEISSPTPSQAAAVAPDNTATAKTVDPVPETPPPASPTPTSPTPATTTNVEEKIETEQQTNSAADVPNNANADDSNPWAHMVCTAPPSILLPFVYNKDIFPHLNVNAILYLYTIHNLRTAFA